MCRTYIKLSGIIKCKTVPVSSKYRDGFYYLKDGVVEIRDVLYNE